MLFQSSPVQNHILSHLPLDAFDRLRPHLRRVQLRRHQILQDPYRLLQSVYFLERGVAVILARTRQDGQVGVGMVGRLGVIGMPVILGTMCSPHRCVVEVPGEALQAGAGDLRKAMDECPVIRQQLLNYVQALIVQNSQTVLCNARHEINQRLARWLLLARDRLDDDLVPLTHDLLSMMLGVRRAGVTDALAALEKRGAIRRRRGAVDITDRGELQQRACECYRIIAAEYQRMVQIRRSDATVLPQLVAAE
jgi:CRP-like cAMP-binding protein